MVFYESLSSLWLLLDAGLEFNHYRNYEIQSVHKLLCFSLKCCDFSELCKFYCSAVIVSIVHTLKRRGNREKQESGIYFKFFELTRYLMNNPVGIYLTTL